MIIDHVGISVSNYDRAKEFYQTVLATLGYDLIQEIKGWTGFGKDNIPQFWIGGCDRINNSTHVAFVAENKEQIEKFYHAAIDAGAKDNGKPKIRQEYHYHYYGAFVIDADGHHIGAVCHKV
ncbi:MAG: VOC family protein [Prochloraceae cyanobacterium]